MITNPRKAVVEELKLGGGGGGGGGSSYNGAYGVASPRRGAFLGLEV